MDYACQTSPIINVRSVSEATRGGGVLWEALSDLSRCFNCRLSVLHSLLSTALSQQAARLSLLFAVSIFHSVEIQQTGVWGG